MSILDLSDKPDDAIEAIIWLSGVMEQAREELDEALAEAYYEARLTGRLEYALGLKRHSRKRVLAYTRRVNNARGRGLRWGDGY